MLILLGALIVPIFAFLKPKSSGGNVFDSIEGAIDRLWWVLPLVIICLYLQYRSDLKKKTLFCPSCEKTFENNRNKLCVCGRELDFFEYYKWEEKPNKAARSMTPDRSALDTRQ